MVDENGQPYAYTGDDPVNGVDPTGLSWYDPSWAHKAASAFASGVRRYDPAYQALEDYDKEYHAEQDGCSLGTVFGFAAKAVAADVETGASVDGEGEVADAVDASVEAGSSGSKVLLDTNAIIRYNDAQTLIGAGEEPVVTQSVLSELADVAARKGFSGQLPAGVGVIDDEEGALLRSQVMEQLRGFGAAPQGIDIDSQVGATALSGSYPLITADSALGNSVAKLGGEWRQLP
jgi:predicted nucleic acid-binding protein